MEKSRPWGMLCTFVLVLITTTTNASTIGFIDQASFIAATGPLTVDHFDAGPWASVDTPLTQPVASLGNDWYGNNNLEAVTANSISGAQSITSLDDLSDLIDTITATLGSGTITAVGGFVFLDFTEGVTLSAFDSGGTLLGDVTTDSSSSSGWQFIGLTSDTTIAKIEFVSTSQPPNDDFLLDDFYFGSAVPVPAAVWLFVSGLLCMTGVARRKSAA